MPTKAERQQAILKVIQETPVATQADLSRHLRKIGFSADQPTLSRDIRELGLIKTTQDGKAYRYATLESASPTFRAHSVGVLKRFIKAMDKSGNLVVIKTDPGNANPVAVAIDRLNIQDIIGTIAGDDTLLTVVREEAKATAVMAQLKELMQ